MRARDALLAMHIHRTMQEGLTFSTAGPYICLNNPIIKVFLPAPGGP